MKDKRLNRVVFLCLLTLGLWSLAGISPANPVRAVERLEILNPEATYTFGRSVTFRGFYAGEAALAEVTVFWQAAGEDRTRQATAALNEGEISYTHQLDRSPIRPFSTVEYWFGARLESGDFALSDTFTFDYTDNRFTWQARMTRDFSIYWVEGDLGFAQQALDVARASREKARAYLPPPATSFEGVRIYIYPNALDLQSALQLGGLTWVAGHADPQLETILLSIAPGFSQVQELERQLPHELMHLMIYRYLQATGGSYRLIPVWLNEGLATLMELYANAEYALLLNEAYEAERLFPMQSLCLSFPTGSREVIQAYAQSVAFVRYLHQRYGASGLQSLLQHYGDGLECERGAEAALGVGLAQLEREWLAETFGRGNGSRTLPQLELSPWLLLLLLVLVIPLLVSLSLGRVRRASLNRQ